MKLFEVLQTMTCEKEKDQLCTVVRNARIAHFSQFGRPRAGDYVKLPTIDGDGMFEIAVMHPDGAMLRQQTPDGKAVHPRFFLNSNGVLVRKGTIPHLWVHRSRLVKSREYHTRNVIFAPKGWTCRFTISVLAQTFNIITLHRIETWGGDHDFTGAKIRVADYFDLPAKF